MESKMREQLLANQPLMDYYVKLRKMIPKHSKDLFRRKVDWQLIKDNDIIEKKMKTWARQKSIELLTEVKSEFVDLVVNLLNKEYKAEIVCDRLDRVLDDQTKEFVKQMWRFLMLEELKLTHRFN